MKKTKIAAIIVALVLILNIIMPVMTVTANSTYTLTFAVKEGTSHTITVDGENNRLIIDGGIVELKDSNNQAIGTVTSTGENSAQITVTEGPEGELNFGGNNFSLFYNGNNYTFGTKINSNQNFLVQDSSGGGETGSNSRIYTVDFNTGSYTIGDATVTVTLAEANNYTNVQLKEDTEISLTNFDAEAMKAVVRGEGNWSTELSVNNGKTSLLNRGSDGNGNLYGIPDGVLNFTVEAKDAVNPEPNPGENPNQPEQPVVNTVANINVSAGSGTWTEKKYNPETDSEELQEKPYDTENVEISINGSRWQTGSQTINYNSQDEDTTVEFTFETMWTDRYYEDIEINGTSYTVKDYFDFDDRTDWLIANHGSQTVEFNIPNVPKASSYNIVVKHGGNSGKAFFANFLWTADPNSENEYDHIGHSKLEFVKAEYEVGDNKYTITEDDLKGKLVAEGQMKVFHSEDGFLSYGVLTDVDYDDGGLTLPGNSKITMRVVPDYGYQVTSVNGDNKFTTTDSGVSEFTVEVPDGTNGYFRATVEKVDNTVKPESEKVKAGDIKLAESASEDIKNGTVRLTVEDIELSSDKIANFQNKANEAGDYTISNYLDINLDKVLYRGTEDSVWSEQIHHLTDKALITLQLEEGIDASNIVIVHNIDNGDEFEIIEIESYDAETNTISFYTDSFSNYAIASKNAKTEETESQETKDAKETKSNMPKTGDNILVVISILVISILGIVGTIKFNKK